MSNNTKSRTLRQLSRKISSTYLDAMMKAKGIAPTKAVNTNQKTFDTVRASPRNPKTPHKEYLYPELWMALASEYLPTAWEPPVSTTDSAESKGDEPTADIPQEQRHFSMEVLTRMLNLPGGFPPYFYYKSFCISTLHSLAENSADLLDKAYDIHETIVSYELEMIEVGKQHLVSELGTKKKGTTVMKLENLELMRQLMESNREILRMRQAIRIREAKMEEVIRTNERVIKVLTGSP